VLCHSKTNVKEKYKMGGTGPGRGPPLGKKRLERATRPDRNNELLSVRERYVEEKENPLASTFCRGKGASKETRNKG